MKARPAHQPSTVPPSPWRWITHAAFVIALAIVIARLTTPDSLRDPAEIAPGGPPTPSFPGPGTALVFDLIAALPAVLVLVRRALDRTNRLVFHWSHALLFAFAGWMMLSTAWSADKFAAAVTSAHFLAGACLLWAMSQLVRSASRLRVTVAVAFGLLLVLVVQSAFYRLIDVPENIAYWNEKKAEILKEHNWEPGSFPALQFEHKLISGELVGFFNSANTFAAVGVLLFAACVGIGFQKWRDGESPRWLLLPGIAAISLIWVLVNAASKAAGATPVLGVGAIAVFLLWKSNKQTGFNSRDHAIAFAGGTGVVVFAMIALVAYAHQHHGLFAGHFSNSLDFRWKYWVASVGIFVTHPLIGIGWDNFGFYYLAHRLPEASEEIKDPHNFLVRIFVELGIVGGILSILWLLRLAWETTLPAKNPGDNDHPMTVKSIAAIVVIGMFLSIAANIDFTMQVADILSLLMKPALYLLALLLATIAAAMLSPHSFEVDHRPAPLVFYCTVTGLGLFLLQNLIDFSWFEAGAMFLFMALLGAALGMAPAGNGRDQPRSVALASAAIGLILWLLAASLFVGPVVLAEQSAANANEMIRTAPVAETAEARTHFLSAADSLAWSAQLIPYNADYIFREAEALLRSGELAKARQLIVRCQQNNPMSVDAYLLEANVQLSGPNPDASVVRRDFDTIVRLNPNDVSFHVQYAQALERFGLVAEARNQYRMAVDADSALPAGEPKRLPASQVEQLRAKSSVKSTD
jgi:O-antigen ligase